MARTVAYVHAPFPLTSSPTDDEQRAVLRATAASVRDHTVVSLALGTGLRLAEIVGLDVGDVFAPNGTPRVRVPIRKEIAKGGRAADVFLPARLVAKLRADESPRRRMSRCGCDWNRQVRQAQSSESLRT
jgi:integrase